MDNLANILQEMHKKRKSKMAATNVLASLVVERFVQILCATHRFEWFSVHLWQHFIDLGHI